MLPNNPQVRLHAFRCIMPPMANCIVCGVTLLSDPEKNASRAAEHSTPLWLLDFMQVANVVSVVTHRGLNESGEHDIIRRYPSLNEDDVYRDTCRGCNNGWLNDLELAVQPFLKQLVRAERRVSHLTHGEREVLTRWMVKTAFFSSHRRTRHDKVTVDQLRHIWRENTVPPGVALLGLTLESEPSYATHCGHEWPVDPDMVVPPEYGYKATFTFGRVALLLAHWSLPGWKLGIVPRLHVPLWPPDSDPVQIPSTVPPEAIAPSHLPFYFHLTLGACSGNLWRARPTVRLSTRGLTRCFVHEIGTFTFLETGTIPWDPRSSPKESKRSRRRQKKKNRQKA